MTPVELRMASYRSPLLWSAASLEASGSGFSSMTVEVGRVLCLTFFSCINKVVAAN